jgi:hypothetical protein
MKVILIAEIVAICECCVRDSSEKPTAKWDAMEF